MIIISKEFFPFFHYGFYFLPELINSMKFRNLWLAMSILFVPPRKHNLTQKRRLLSVLVVLYRVRSVINCVLL